MTHKTITNLSNNNNLFCFGKTKNHIKSMQIQQKQHFICVGSTIQIQNTKLQCLLITLLQFFLALHEQVSVTISSEVAEAFDNVYIGQLQLCVCRCDWCTLLTVHMSHWNHHIHGSRGNSGANINSSSPSSQ